MFSEFYVGKQVLVTGHTGFKGSWLTIWLKHLGAKIAGIALPPATKPSLFTLARVGEGINHHQIDLRDQESLLRTVRKVDPQVVFHLAAQPLVRASYVDPVGTIATNVLGTAHLLEALRVCQSLRVVVIITTDKVYRNNEWPYPYREDDPLGGHDPYSASKAAAEIITASYKKSFLSEQGVAVSTARAGNVIGGGDWSADRLLPDAIRAWFTGNPLRIRRPQAIRPWQHVLEPLAGYLELARAMWDTPACADAYNFGPETGEAASVRDVIELARRGLDNAQVVWENGNEGPHEARWLGLEIAKARSVLGVRPRWALNEAVGRTMAWYLCQHKGEDARKLCLSEIDAYEQIMTVNHE